MSRDKSQEDITLLGKKNVKYHYDYCPEILETFENRHPDNDYWVKFNCPEFTALCPITGQPDYATIYISYVPGKKMVESKSLKLYLVSFRNHGDFHEDVVNVIMKDLIALMDPKYIESGASSCRAAAFPSIPTPITAVQARSMRSWPSTVSWNMTSSPWTRSITADNARDEGMKE